MEICGTMFVLWRYIIEIMESRDWIIEFHNFIRINGNSELISGDP